MAIEVCKHAGYALAGCTLLLSGTAALAKDAYCFGVRNNTSIYMTKTFQVPANIAEAALPNDYERLLRAKYMPDGSYQVKCLVNTDTNALELSKKRIENFAQTNRLDISLTAAPVHAGSGNSAAPAAGINTQKQAAAPSSSPAPASPVKEKPADQTSSPGHMYCSSFIDRQKPGDPPPAFYVSPLFTLSQNTPWPAAFPDIKQKWAAVVGRTDSRMHTPACDYYEPDQAAVGRAKREERIQRMSRPPNGIPPVAVHMLDWTYRQ